MNGLYETVDYCRVCYSWLDNIWHLGDKAIVDFRKDRLERRAPLELMICKNPDCQLVQLHHNTNPDVLYRENYWYQSGINKTMRKELADIVEQARNWVSLEEEDYALDIGCNDGTLLRNYPRNINAIGYEPSILAFSARDHDIGICHDFFTFVNCKVLLGDKKAKIITAIAMFYDLPDPNDFVKGVKEILDSHGVFIIQMNYLPSMLKNNTFDNISHEHLEFYTLKSLQFLLSKHDLVIKHAVLNNTNGGSIRLFIEHNRGQSPSIGLVALLEKEKNLDIRMEIIALRKRVDDLKKQTVTLLENLKKMGKTIWGYGASTRGSVILQYYGLDDSIITSIADRNPDKYNKYMPGTNIQITSEENMRIAKPDYLFVLPYHFKEEFLEREKEYLKYGAMIFPLPKLQSEGCGRVTIISR